MLEKLGIVTNIWANRLNAGDRFEDLVKTFDENGFRYMELRDSDEFRTCEFGGFITEIEAAMARYTDAQWKAICEHKEYLPSRGDIYREQDRSLCSRIADFASLTKGISFTYAIPHPWMILPDEIAKDDERIVQAIKLAYLLGPADARLRFVDPTFKGPVNESETISNLKRYCTVSVGFPVRLCVENAHLPATLTLDLAVRGGVGLAYDEANIYDTEGGVLNPPADFWHAVKTETLAGVHIKQKTSDGVSSWIGDGYVDFKTILKHLKDGGFNGDLLLENAPSDAPLADALRSREYIEEVYGAL
jgi:sugar phosphate isomerase/epimerase